MIYFSKESETRNNKKQRLLFKIQKYVCYNFTEYYGTLNGHQYKEFTLSSWWPTSNHKYNQVNTYMLSINTFVYLKYCCLPNMLTYYTYQGLFWYLTIFKIIYWFLLIYDNAKYDTKCYNERVRFIFFLDSVFYIIT